MRLILQEAEAVPERVRVKALQAAELVLSERGVTLSKCLAAASGRFVPQSTIDAIDAAHRAVDAVLFSIENSTARLCVLA